MRRGARQIGLEVEWRFEFVGHGTTLAPERDIVAVDVGGRLCPGIVDQHGREESTSSGALVTGNVTASHAHLLDTWLDQVDRGGSLAGKKAIFTVRMHADPDFDCVVSSWLVMRVVESGEFPRFHQALTEYTTRVDQGAYPFRRETWADALHALHIGYLGVTGLDQPARKAIAAALGVKQGSPYDTNVRIGHALLDDLLARDTKLEGWSSPLRSGLDFDPQTISERLTRHGISETDAKTLRELVTGWREIPALKEHLVPVLEADRGRYERDRADMVEETIEVPAEGGAFVEVRAYVARVEMTAKLNKYWVRGDGYPLFVCVYDVKEHDKVVADRKRYVISLDPNYVDEATGRRPLLQGLGAALERLECRRREALNLETRDRVPRWPGVTNADPWYDGRSHDWGIVDCPRDKSVLTLDEVLETLRGPFWEDGMVLGCTRVTRTLAPPTASQVEAHPADEAFVEDTPDAFLQDEVYPFVGRRSLENFGQAETKLPEGWRLVSSEPERCSARVVDRLEVAPTSADVVAGHQLEVIVLRVAPGALGGLVEHIASKLPPTERFVQPFGPCTLVASLRRQVFVVPEGVDEAELERHLRLAALIWSYVQWQDSKMSEYSSSIASIVPASRSEDARNIDVAAADQLGREFLRFEARFWQIEIVRPAYARAYHRHLASHVRISDQFTELREEVKRAEALAHTELQSRQNLLVSVVGATSTVGTVKGFWPTIVEYGRAFRDFVGIHPVIVSLSVPLSIAVLTVILYQLLEYVRPGSKKAVARMRKRIAGAG